MSGRARRRLASPRPPAPAAPGLGAPEATNLAPLFFFLFAATAFYYVYASHDYFSSSNGLLDATGHLIGRDFINLWVASDLWLRGDVAAIFDTRAFHSEQMRLAGVALKPHIWSYPPHMLFVAGPLAQLGYIWAFAAWCLVTSAVFLAATLAPSRHYWMWLALALFPAVFINAFAGQTGALAAALLVGGLRLLDRRPVLAGICFGLLTIKPQLGLLVPLALVAGRHWIAIAAATIAATALIGASLAVHGIESWHRYFADNMPATRAFLELGEGTLMQMIPSIFMAGRIWGAPPTAAYALQAISAAAAAAVAIWTFRGRHPTPLRNGIMLAATALASPYIHNYDLCIVGAALMLAFEHRRPAYFSAGERILGLFVWFVPVVILALNAERITVAPIILWLFCLALCRLAAASPPDPSARAPAA